MTIRWFTDEDRERMRKEAAEHAEIRAELDRLHRKYARIAHRPTTPAEVEKERRLMRMHATLQIRPWK